MLRDKIYLILISLVLGGWAYGMLNIAHASQGEWQATAYYQEKVHGLPPGFLSALIEQESRWKPNAVSSAGAIGLAQLLPSTVEMIAPGRYEHKLFYWGADHVAVAQIQAALARNGYYHGPVDGRFFNFTDSAVRTFQLDNGLAVDGVVGPVTWAALLPKKPFLWQSIVDALNDPHENIKLAAEYFTWMRRRPECPASLAGLVAAYYSGCGSQVVRYVVEVEQRYGSSL